LRRLVAVRVAAPWRGAWQWFQGNEVAVVADGPEVTLEVERQLADGSTCVDIFPLVEGPTPLPPPGELMRYRVVGGARPTTVEMLLRVRGRLREGA
jgi:hypothetical protein